MGLKIIGYDEDENPQYEWVDDDTDQFQWNPDNLSSVGEGGPAAPNIYPDGYGGYVTGDGTPIAVTKNDRGELISSTGQKLPTNDALGNPIQESNAAGTPTNFTADQIKNLPGGAGVINSIKGYFKKKDAQGNVIKNAAGEDQYDWAKIIGAGTVISAASGLNQPNRTPTGYQGGIPSLVALRSQIPGTYDPNRRAGSGGQRYFSDSAFVGKGDTQGIADAQTRLAENATDIIKANKANPAYQKKEEITRSVDKKDPVSGLVIKDTGMRSFAPATKPASGIASTLWPVQTQAMKDSYGAVDLGNKQPDANATTVTKAHGGLMGMAKGQYLRGDTDGMADELNTSIDNSQPAKLSHGEFVIPADVVSHLGNGNSDAGAKKLYQMMDKIRVARTGTKKQGKQINPDKFMPGGPIKYSSGGGIKGFDGTTGSTVTANKSTATGTESNLSNWVGPYATSMLGEAQALGAKPYEAYQGPLTADASGLQKQAFQTGMDLTVPVSGMGGFTPTSFGAEQAQNYMNPFITAALNPRLEEMSRQHAEDMARQRGIMATSGRGSSFGGSAQALAEAANNRNLLQEQNKTIGQGYYDAYNKAMEQFNKEQGLGLQAQDLTNKYGLSALEEQAKLGATQRAIESEGIAADRAQFEEEKLDPYKKLQFKQSMLQGLPTSAQQTNFADQNTLQRIFGGLSDATIGPALLKNLQDLGIIPK